MTFVKIGRPVTGNTYRKIGNFGFLIMNHMDPGVTWVKNNNLVTMCAVSVRILVSITPVGINDN